jgi:hypothetical protein
MRSTTAANLTDGSSHARSERVPVQVCYVVAGTTFEGRDTMSFDSWQPLIERTATVAGRGVYHVARRSLRLDWRHVLLRGHPARATRVAPATGRRRRMSSGAAAADAINMAQWAYANDR